MITVLTWISIIAGGVLILLLLLSLLGGLELDIDLGDSDLDAGGLGIIKGVLTFTSIGSWVIKLVLATDQHPIIAIGSGLIAGLIAVVLLNFMIQLLLKNTSNVNWKPEDAIHNRAKVYLKIPASEGTGIIQIEVKGAVRELKAKTENGLELPTGSTVYISDIQNGIAIVDQIES